MKKLVVLLVFLSLLVSSCGGTKYVSTQQTAPKSVTKQPTKNSRVSSEDLENIHQEEVNFEYVEYTENYSLFDFNYSLADNIIQTATQNLGVRYRYGGTTKSGMDCSGLVMTSFQAHDISLPRTSFEMAEYGTKIRESETQKGDLIFFITNGGRRINHVGIVTEANDDEIKFIHASTKLGVIISSTKEPYYKKNYVKVARVL